MRISLFLIFSVIIFFCSVNQINGQQKRDYKAIDEYVRTCPFKVASLFDIKTFVREAKLIYKNPDDLARIAFIWIAKNISYDCEGLNNGNGIYIIDDVLKDRKAICQGYAELFKYFCDQFGIECEIVVGVAANGSRQFKKLDDLKSNHAWNVVKVNSEWKIIDPTWGSGSTSNGCKHFEFSLDEQYFYSKPEEFIKSHFPDSIKWQLVKEPYTKVQFLESAIAIQKAFAFASNQPSDSIINKRVGEKIQFYFPITDTFNSVLFSVYYNKNEEPIDYWDSIKIKDGKYYVDFTVKKVGLHRLYISFFNEKEGDTDNHGSNQGSYILKVTASIKPVAGKKSNAPSPKKK